MQEELTQILQASTPPPVPVASALFIPFWWERRQDPALRYNDPPLRLILILDNLAGHKSRDLVRWLCSQGILPLYTPLSGSWLNMAESVQRILVRRALAGTHPQSPAEIITWLEQTVRHWNATPTPFVWDGQRRQRRVRARQRRLGGSQATTAYGNLIAA